MFPVVSGMLCLIEFSTLVEHLRLLLPSQPTVLVPAMKSLNVTKSLCGNTGIKYKTKVKIELVLQSFL